MTATAASSLVRVATKEDFDRVTEVVTEAFIHDPVFSYFASLKELIPKDHGTKEKDNLRKWARFLVTAGISSGGRLTVIVEHEESSPERIVGMALWLPPNKRLALWHVRTLLKAGIVGMLRRWGLPGLLRCGFEYMDGIHKAMVKGLRKKDIKRDPEASWYLQLTAIVPECQGKGYMSKLIREAYEYAPNEMFTLDATTAASRDKYAHVGFEGVETLTLGKGKSNAQGITARGKSATGVEMYCMVKTPN